MRRAIRNLPLSGKLMLVALVTTTLALSLAMVTFGYFERRALSDALGRDLETAAEMVGGMSTAALTFNDASVAEEHLAALEAFQHIESACIFAADGDLFASYQRSLGKQVECRRRHFEGYRIADGLATVSLPVLLEDQRIGTIVIHANLSPVNEKMYGFARIGVLVVALAALGALTLSWRLHGIITQPIRHLVAAAKQVSETKDYSVRAEKQADDEIGVLADTFNEMLHQIQSHEELLVHDALHDQLTGLPNRTLFMERLGHAIDLSRDDGTYQFALAFIDLDNFKLVNDSLGHLKGDELLKAAARRFTASVRPTDIFARFGGDEFTVLLEHLEGPSQAFRLARRLQESLEAPFDLDGCEVFTTASIGVAFAAREVVLQPQDLLRAANRAMYRAKTKGRNRIEVFDEEMHEEAISSLELETDLRRAIQRQEFRVFFQPIVNLADGQIEGFEALLRWQHPDRGLLTPAAFLHLAEDTGQIVQIGNWILREACGQLAEWRDRGLGSPLLSISVNLAAKQMYQQDLVSHVANAVADAGLAPADLKLEITESVMAEERRFPQHSLEQLRDLGVKLHIADFGTGQSSLSRLHRLTVDALKIDRSFVMDIVAGEKRLVAAIINLAGSLGLGVIAEGVETREQLRQLVDLGCGRAQGYYFSRPVDAQAATALLTAGGTRAWPHLALAPLSQAR